jgi:hypothetical protein
MISRVSLLLLIGVLLAACQANALERPSPATIAEPDATSSLPTTTAAPTAGPRPTIRPTPTARPNPRPTPTPAAFALSLYQNGDFVPQHTFEWCVGASLQMAHNLVEAGIRSSYEDQQRLWELARDRSSNSFRGANPVGWTAALNEMGLGRYELVSVPDYEDALRTAAAAMHATQRPVGLVMWSGRHAWVMSGFESIGDPAIHAEFHVTGVRVLDPLFPHGSGMWGASPAPNSLLSPEELATQFVIREPRRWSTELGTGYFLVLPVTAAETDNA